MSKETHKIVVKKVLIQESINKQIKELLSLAEEEGLVVTDLRLSLTLVEFGSSQIVGAHSEFKVSI